MVIRKYLMCLIIPLLLLYVFAMNSHIGIPQYTGVYPDEFPLSIDLNRTVFCRGEKIAFNATVTNNCGQDINVATGGSRPGPGAYFCLRPFDLTPTVAPMAFLEFLVDGEAITAACEFWAIIPGVYSLEVYYSMYVYDDINLSWDDGYDGDGYGLSINSDSILLRGRLDTITIVVL